LETLKNDNTLPLFSRLNIITHYWFHSCCKKLAAVLLNLKWHSRVL
jgi:hypothetical protein